MVEVGARCAGKHHGHFDAGPVHRAHPIAHFLQCLRVDMSMEIDCWMPGLGNGGFRDDQRCLGRIVLQGNRVRRARRSVHTGTAPASIARLHPLGIRPEQCVAFKHGLLDQIRGARSRHAPHSGARTQRLVSALRLAARRFWCPRHRRPPACGRSKPPAIHPRAAPLVWNRWKPCAKNKFDTSGNVASRLRPATHPLQNFLQADLETARAANRRVGRSPST
jgi:hypothetical protein